jgi:rRNA-processing protein FCF1
MRILRHKANRKAMQFFRIAFKIEAPFRVLLDGNFIAHAVRMSVDFAALLPKLLDGLTHLHITECVLEELKLLGDKAAPVVAAARSIAVLRCRHKHGHTSDMDAATCLTRMVGPRNEGHWIVATQDADLRHALRAVPGTPLVLYSHNVLVLEQPSKASHDASAGTERDKAGITADELRMIKAARAVVKAGGAAAALPTAPEPLDPALLAAAGRAVPVLPPPSAAGGAGASPGDLRGRRGTGAAATTGGVGGEVGYKRKRSRTGAPNPLSVKKPVAKPRASGGAGGGEDDGGDGASTVARRNRRKRKHAGAAGGAGDDGLAAAPPASRRRVEGAGEGSDGE